MAYNKTKNVYNFIFMYHFKQLILFNFLFIWIAIIIAIMFQGI